MAEINFGTTYWVRSLAHSAVRFLAGILAYGVGSVMCGNGGRGQVNEVVWNGQSDAILMAAGRQSATYTEKGVVVPPAPPTCG